MSTLINDQTLDLLPGMKKADDGMFEYVAYKGSEIRTCEIGTNLFAILPNGADKECANLAEAQAFIDNGIENPPPTQSAVQLMAPAAA